MNIAALVSQAFGISRDLAPDAFPTCTLRLNSTTAVNPANGSDVTTWETEVPNLKPVGYNSKQEQENQPAEANAKAFAFDTADLPGTSRNPDQSGQVEEGDITWEIYRAEADPTGSLFIFYCRR